MIALIGVSKITDPIDVALSILNIKLVDPTVFLSSWMKASSCWKAFSWPMLPVDQVEVFELMSKFLNLLLLYRELVKELKM